MERRTAQPELRAEDLVGTWLLESIRVSLRGRTLMPPGSGTLVYTASGHFAAVVHLALPGVPVVGKSLGYTGPFTVDDGVVTHHTRVATWPFGAGRPQRRWVTLLGQDGAGDGLRLSGRPDGAVQFCVQWSRSADER